METNESKSILPNSGFLNHVFNFDEESKHEYFNIMQYSSLAVIPCIFLIKAIQTILPEPDEDKSSLEITAEVLFQVIFMFIGLYIIHKIITYIPTYSGNLYSEFNVTNIILAVLVIVLSLQTRLGEKSNILYIRFLEMINGRPKVEPTTNEQNSNPNLIIPQINPQQQIAQNLNQIVPTSQPGIMNINHQQPSGNMPQMPQQPQPQQQSPQQVPGVNMGLLAANEALGGSFGSLF